MTPHVCAVGAAAIPFYTPRMSRIGFKQLFHPRRASQLLAAALLVRAVTASAEVSQPTARPAPAWVRDGIVYEVFPRAFSAAGDLNGVTARLDELKDLGVTIVWLM